MDKVSTKTIMSLVATTSSKIRDLTISDGQLIFIQDAGRIAFDYKRKRVFYNQIVELENDIERLSLESPLSGYYFVIDTAVLWTYRNGWVQITGEPNEILFVGVELPELGQKNKIYANTKSGNENVSVWDEDLNAYVIVADKTQAMTSEEVIALFNS